VAASQPQQEHGHLRRRAPDGYPFKVSYVMGLLADGGSFFAALWHFRRDIRRPSAPAQLHTHPLRQTHPRVDHGSRGTLGDDQSHS
jgi:hypothetical protein